MSNPEDTCYSEVTDFPAITKTSRVLGDEQTISIFSGAEATSKSSYRIPREFSFSKNTCSLTSLHRSKRPHRSYSISECTENDSSLLSCEDVMRARSIAQTAYQTNKIFTVIGPYPSIRKALRDRGWVEKFADYRAADYSLPILPLKVRNGIINDDLFNMRSPRNTTKPSKTVCNTDEFSTDDNDDTDFDFENGGIPFLLNKFVEDQKRKPWEDDNGFLATLSKLLKYAAPTYIWTLRKATINMRNLRKEQSINHLNSAPFTTKIGLCRSLNDLPWVENSSTDSFFPRCYIITEEEERQAFIDDFRLTACMGIIRLVKQIDTSSSPQIGMYLGDSPHGDKGANQPELCEQHESYLDQFYMRNFSQFRLSSTQFPVITPAMQKKQQAPEEIIKFAILYVKQYLYDKNHFDIDNLKPKISLSPIQWKNFLSWTYKVFQEHYTIVNADAYAHLSQILYAQFIEIHDQESIDGHHNIWIIKPAAKSRGRGIGCFNQLESILRFTETSLPVSANRLIAQKYIEKPLLIYDTKFDIRQWFMVTEWSPLTIWWYKKCYLRFCSHEFTLDRLDESVHLSNNSIQYKYRVNRKTNAIPSYNMWYLDQFLDHLRKHDKEDLWAGKVLPGMKRAVINAMLCSQNTVEPRKNSFEIFGADFMISSPDFSPWLIEINSSPCMAASTEVTAKLSALVLEDVVRVTVDKKFDKNADTGEFELIYRQNVVAAPPYLGIDLTVNGTRLHKPTRPKPPHFFMRKNPDRTLDTNSSVTVETSVEKTETVTTKSTGIRINLPLKRDMNNNEPVKKRKTKFRSLSDTRSDPYTRNTREPLIKMKALRDNCKPTQQVAKPNMTPYKVTKVELVSVVPTSKPNPSREAPKMKPKQEKFKNSSFDAFIDRRNKTKRNLVAYSLPKVEIIERKRDPTPIEGLEILKTK